MRLGGLRKGDCAASSESRILWLLGRGRPEPPSLTSVAGGGIFGWCPQHVALPADLAANARNPRSKHPDSHVSDCGRIFLVGAPGGHFRDGYPPPPGCRCCPEPQISDVHFSDARAHRAFDHRLGSAGERNPTAPFCVY